MLKIFKYHLLVFLLLLFRLSYGQLPDLVTMEYFFDTDPSFGNAIAVPVVADSLIETSFDADVSGLAGGYHILYVRAKDELGYWSFVFADKFFINPESVATGTPEVLPEITQMEYFFDADPGFGNAIAVPVVADSLVETSFDADVSGLAGGYHILYVRLKDELGNWSMVFTNKFFTNPESVAVATPEVLPQITQMEYFFDTDPGFGNANAVPVIADSLIETSFDADVSGLASGYHILYVRVKNELGNWSMVFTNKFFTNPEPVAVGTPEVLPQITQMEYFFDSDPGFGNANAVPVVADSLIETSFDTDISGLNVGYHILFVRVKDEYGNWGIVFTNKFFKEPEPVTPGTPEALPQITQMEYFFDMDPGFGNGTEVPLTPDSLLIENFMADVLALDVGEHLIFFRVKDENNRWSLSTVDRLYIKGLQVFLEGAYDTVTGLMSTELNENGLLPLVQPFGSEVSAVWFYDGNENVAVIPNANVVDWVLLQVRDTLGPANATSATIKENQPAFLLKNGKIVGLDGESPVSFEPVANEPYLVIFHRNHLGVMSSFPINQSGASDYSYNFTNRPSRVYGGSVAQKEMTSDVWGMPGGDADGNGTINMNDKTNVWSSQTGEHGYLSGDFNLDAEVSNQDKNDLIVPNNNLQTQVPD